MTPNDHSTALLEAKEIGKKLGRRWVLNNISFEVKKGQSYLVKGANGSGKTTLLRTISGIYHPGRGKLLFPDSNKEPRKSKGRICFVEQNSSLYPQLTVGENLQLFSKLSGEDVKNASALSEKFSLKEHWNTRLNNCSSGTIRKVSIVRALSSNADLILLDEPFNFLDSSSRSTLAELLSDFVCKGGSLVLASNNDLETYLSFNEIWTVEEARVRKEVC